MVIESQKVYGLLSTGLVGERSFATSSCWEKVLHISVDAVEVVEGAEVFEDALEYHHHHHHRHHHQPDDKTAPLVDAASIQINLV